MNKTRLALKKFYDKVGERYPEEEQVYHTLRGMLRKKFVLSHLNRFRGRLLEIGCNRGMYLQAYQHGERFGVDISLPVLKKAHRGNKLHLAVADAERLYCFRPGSFDHILCSEVLEHCLNPDQVFSGIFHLLKPGGVALLTTPNYTREKPTWIGLGTLTLYDIDYDCGDEYFHTAYKPEELETMAGRAGLTVAESGTLEREIKYAAKIPAAVLLFIRLLNRPLKSKLIERVNEALFNKLTIILYYIAHYSGLERLILPLFPVGVRSYILVKKGP